MCLPNYREQEGTGSSATGSRTSKSRLATTMGDNHLNGSDNGLLPLGNGKWGDPETNKIYSSVEATTDRNDPYNSFFGADEDRTPWPERVAICLALSPFILYEAVKRAATAPFRGMSKLICAAGKVDE